MKKICAFLTVFLVLLAAISPAMAVEDGENAETEAPSVTDTPAPEPVTQLLQVQQEGGAVAVADLDAAPTLSGFPAILSGIFGTYAPRTQTVTTYLSDGSSVTSVEIVPGLAGLDWYWLSGVLLFALVLFGLLRFLGVIFKR